MKAAIPSLQEHVAADWARLGVLFNVTPAARTPDLEKLLLHTAEAAPGNTRLLIMAATWLLEYGECVAKRRLAVMVRDELALADRPVMGLMLDWVRGQDSRHRRRFDEVLAHCRPATEPRPLAQAASANPALSELARRQASPLSLRWGRWIEPFEPKVDALRPVEWVARHNPSLALRALCGGDLVATMAADARAGRGEFTSEAAMARRYGASRAAVRGALRKLKLAGYARQIAKGKSHAVFVALR